jgi:hypothetical protein
VKWNWRRGVEDQINPRLIRVLATQPEYRRGRVPMEDCFEMSRCRTCNYIDQQMLEGYMGKQTRAMMELPSRHQVKREV